MKNLLECRTLRLWFARAASITSCVAVGLLASFPSVAGAQDLKNINSEWIQASSPLPGGGQVTTTYVPGTSTGPVTKVTYAPINQAATSSQRPQIANANLGNVPLNTQAGMIPVTNQQFGNTGFQNVRTANGTTLMPVVSYIPVNGSYYNPGAVRQVQLQSPGLCQTPVAGTQPVLGNNGGIYGPLTGQRPVNPGNTGFYPAGPVRPNTGAGYRPLIRRPLPAGTYIGQGWLGQPKAYVNNQPLRNMLRYIIIP